MFTKRTQVETISGWMDTLFSNFDEYFYHIDVPVVLSRDNDIVIEISYVLTLTDDSRLTFKVTTEPTIEIEIMEKGNDPEIIEVINKTTSVEIPELKKSLNELHKNVLEKNV